MDKREKKSFFFKNLFLQFMSYPHDHSQYKKTISSTFSLFKYLGSWFLKCGSFKSVSFSKQIISISVTSFKVKGVLIIYILLIYSKFYSKFYFKFYLFIASKFATIINEANMIDLVSLILYIFFSIFFLQHCPSFRIQCVPSVGSTLKNICSGPTFKN